MTQSGFRATRVVVLDRSPTLVAHFFCNMSPKIIIVGGGISGLIASWYLSAHADVEVFEPGEPGGEFLAGGLKYIHRTSDMEDMFDDLRIIHSAYIVRGGILLRGQLYLYPQLFDDLDPEEARRIQEDHYRKTRRTAPGDNAKRAMNDPAATGPRKALRCDFRELIDALIDDARPKTLGVKKVDHRRNVLFDSENGVHHYDFLIMTTPLWITRRLVSFRVPEGVAMKLNVAQVSSMRDAYGSFDYVYTPYTPEDAVHRFSPRGAGYSVETNGDLDMDKLRSDLAFLFPSGYSIENVREGLKGHLLPLKEQPDWPSNVAPLGRFATWDSRATTDVVLESLKGLKKRWQL